MTESPQIKPKSAWLLAIYCLIVTSLVIVLPSSKTQATTLPVVDKFGMLMSSETWSAGYVYHVQNVTVPDGVILTIEPGAIVKVSQWSSAIQVGAGGVLNVAGSVTNEVVFTSWQDDTAGGDSNADGSVSSPALGDYYGAISTQAGATVDVQHSIFQYGRASIDASGSYDGTTSVVVRDSDMGAAVHLNGLSKTEISFQRNTFDVYPWAYNDYFAVGFSGTNPSEFILSGPDANVFSENGMNTVAVSSSYVEAGDMWSVGGIVLHTQGVNIAGTLNIEPGTIVKPNQWSNGFTVESGGSINALGTSAAPVSFTSWQDDTVGGDSNRDGSGTLPAMGNYYAAIDVKPGGSVDIAHANFSYGRNSVSASGYRDGNTEISVTDSVIRSVAYLGHLAKSEISFERNLFDVPIGIPNVYTAVQFSGSNPSRFILSGADTNIFGPNSLRTIGITGGSNQPVIEYGDSWTIENIVVRTLAVNIAGTLNLGPNTVVKPEYGSGGFTVESGGTLSAVGTSAGPIIFTSRLDDTAGGDSNGDADITVPGSGDYSTAIQAKSGSTVFVSHADIRYGINSVDALGTNDGSTSITVLDSTIRSAVSLSSLLSSEIDIRRNLFNVAETGPNALSNYWAIGLVNTGPSGIVLAGADTNTFGSSSRRAIYILGSDGVPPLIDSGDIWSVGGGASLYLNNLRVAGTLNLGPGAVVKSLSNSTPIDIEGSGTLNTTGTEANPVIFTSWYDDTAGGDSNGDGSVTTPSVNDNWGYIFAMQNTGVFMQHTYFHYARYALTASGDVNINHAAFTSITTAAAFSSGDVLMQDTYINAYDGLLVSGDARVTFRGTFDVDHMAIQSCDWPPLFPQPDPDNVCAVDAAYSEWGDGAGPFPTSGKLVCGVMTTSPWKYNSATYYGGSIFGSGNCSNTNVPTAEAESRIEALMNAYEAAQDDCSNDIAEACDLAAAQLSCFGSIVDAIGEDVPWEMPPASSASAVTEIIDMIDGTVTSYFEDNALEFLLGDNATFKRDLVMTGVTLVRLGDAASTCSNP